MTRARTPARYAGSSLATDTLLEVARANEALAEIATAAPSIHGAFRCAGGEGDFPLVTVGLHCSACNTMVGGATDFSGEVGPPHGRGAARALLRTLAERGCHHAAALLSALAATDEGAEPGQGRIDQ